MQIVKDVQLVEVIGRGSSGIVYHAKTNSADVAAKTLLTLCDPQFGYMYDSNLFKKEKKKFIQEIVFMSEFSHENIVKTFGVWYSETEERQVPFMVFELGKWSLNNYLLKHKISKLEGLEFGRQILAALIYLHERSFIHRDLKPANVIVVEQENRKVLKLVDFGASRSTTKTLMDTETGTYFYRDPIVLKSQYDKSIDIYSFGCTLVHILCGFEDLAEWKLPKDKEENQEEKLENDLPKWIVNKLGPECAALVRHCIAPTPQRADLHALSVELEAIIAKLQSEYEIAGRIDKLTEAARLGDAAAQYTLAHSFEKGIDVEKNLQKALEFYTLAAQQGNPVAQKCMGNFYYFGIAVEKNLSKAVEFFTTSAKQGNADAQTNLGNCYKNGTGVERDVDKAVELYMQASLQNNAVAQFMLGCCNAKGIGLAKNDKKAFEFYKSAAKQNHAQAQNNLGFCYSQGVGVQQNWNKAFKYYHRAAAQGFDKALNNVGYCYQHGLGVQKDSKKAFEVYSQSSVLGNAEAIGIVGHFYEHGIGVEKKLMKAVALYTSAALQENPQALKNLGRCYQHGIGVKKDLVKAKELYIAAAHKGNVEAQNLLEIGFCVIC